MTLDLCGGTKVGGSHRDLGVGFRSQVANLSSSEIYDLGSENTHTHTICQVSKHAKKATKQQWRSSNVHTTTHTQLASLKP